MNLVIPTEETGVLELNYMWLPTWIGINHALKKEIEEAVAAEFIHDKKDPFVMEPKLFRKMDVFIIELLQNKFPEIELSTYLKGIWSVQQNGQDLPTY